MGTKISSIQSSESDSKLSFLHSTISPYIPKQHTPPRAFSYLPFKFYPLTSSLLKQFTNDPTYSRYQLIQSKQYIRACYQQINQSIIISKYYFRQQFDYNNFLTAIFNIKQLEDIKLYTEINQSKTGEVYVVQMEIKHTGTKLEHKLSTLDTQKKILILIVCCSLMSRLRTIRIDPESIIVQDGKCYLTNIVYDESFNNRGVDMISIWLFSQNKVKFEEILSLDSLTLSQQVKQLQIPLILNLVINSYRKQQINLQKVIELLEGICERSSHLSFRMDSLHACLYYRSQQLYASTNSWIYFKQSNNIYFYHVYDEHGHITSLIRKKDKILLDDVSIVFDQDEFEMIIPRKGTKHLIRANEFELENHDSISDITLYQKLPIKIDSGKLTKIQNDLLLLEKNLYRIDPRAKTIKQIIKQVSKDVIIGVMRDKSEPFVIKQSKDFLREGIKILGKQLEYSLSFAVSESSLPLLSGVVLNLEEAEFCLEVFCGVFLLFACRSIWILDLNLKCFFSYASVEQIKNYNQNHITHPIMYNYMFATKNQPFVVQFPKHQNSTHALLNKGQLFILGWRGDQPLCIQYYLQPLTGSVIMRSFTSLGYNKIPNQLELFKVRVEEDFDITTHTFNVENDEIFLYKYEPWKIYGDDFLMIHNSSIASTPEKGYKITVMTEKVNRSLKEELRHCRDESYRLSKREILLLIRRVVEIYSSLHFCSVTHRGFTLSALYFTPSNKLKLRSWTEPPRLQYVSDFKDLFTVIFNIITSTELDTVTSNIIEMHSKKLSEYPQIHRMIIKNIKLAVTQERKQDIQKTITQLKNHIENEMLKQVEGKVGNSFIFRYQVNSPRLYAMQIYERKLIRLEVSLEENDKWSFGFDDQCVWNQSLSVLYILTPTNFLSIKIEFDILQDKQQLKVKADIEQLPQKKINKPTLCLLSSSNLLYCFGGIETTKDQQAIISSSINVFNLMTLCWEQKQSLCCSLAGATAISSLNQKSIYLFGGISSDYDMNSSCLKVFIYNIQKGTSVLYIDNYHQSPFQNSLNPPLVLLYTSQQSKQLFVIYENHSKNHKATLIELVAGGLFLEFELEEKQKENQVNVEKKDENEEKGKKARIVKFNSPSNKYGGQLKEINRKLPQLINLSTKDKSIYFLDYQNRLLIFTFKSGSQAILDIFNVS